jgi:xanthine dehydrogenase small subunit
MIERVMPFRFRLNDKDEVAAPADPHQSLLEWLRQSGRTGSKEGCAEGECGACAVAVIRCDAEGRARYETINSCLLPLGCVDGHAVMTVEGLAEPDGTLHPVQKAMVDGAGSQCGYCTPGFVVSLFCEYYRPDREGYDPEAISGNLCRCTGYRPIVDVARALPVAPAEDAHHARLRTSLPVARDVDYGVGERHFFRPATLPEALDVASRFPDARWIAGGTDLMVYRAQRYERWPALISLDGIAELLRVDFGEREIAIGAGVRLAHLEAILHRDRRGAVPLFEQLLPLFSSRLIRNRATLGGNLGTASPIGDTPPALLALDAELTLVSARGTRRVALVDFFLGYRKTALAQGELIASVHLPLPLPRRQRFYKVSKRVLDDISSVAGAFALDLDAQGNIARLRVAFGGVAATPLRPKHVEDAAVGRPWNVATRDWLAGELAGVGTPMTDHRASAAYRRAMLGKLTEKFWEDTARGSEPVA